MAHGNLKILDYKEKYQDSLVACLGFFDSLHQGHIQLLKKAELIANLKSIKVGVFTFKNNPFEYLKKDSLQVLTFEERCQRLENNNVDCVLFAEFDSEFASLLPEEFLDLLFKNKNITDIVVGSDYTFGKNAAGNIEFLQKYCLKNRINLQIENLKMLNDDQKFSSREIRKLIQSGNVDEIFHLLSAPYIVVGKVINGRKVGKKIGFPTANINLDKSKEKLASGVYYTNTILDGVSLRSVTNVGQHPTFNDCNFNIETHILFFNQDIYGKEITIEFLSRIRDIKKFESVEELVIQLKKDCQFVANL